MNRMIGSVSLVAGFTALAMGFVKEASANVPPPGPPPCPNEIVAGVPCPIQMPAHWTNAQDFQCTGRNAGTCYPLIAVAFNGFFGCTLEPAHIALGKKCVDKTDMNGQPVMDDCMQWIKCKYDLEFDTCIYDGGQTERYQAKVTNDC